MRNVVIRLMLFAGLGSAINCNTSPAPAPASAPQGKPRALLQSVSRAYKNPASTTLYLYKDGTNCKADVEDDPVGALHERYVTWVVVNESCETKDAYPKVSLQFAADSHGKYPFKDATVKSKKANDFVYINEKLLKSGEVDAGTFKYSVYLLNGTTQDSTKPILDPDLEIEPPPPTPIGETTTAPPVKRQ